MEHNYNNNVVHNGCKHLYPSVAEDAVLGRHWVASRDLKAGEVLLRDAPLVLGPRQASGMSFRASYA